MKSPIERLLLAHFSSPLHRPSKEQNSIDEQIAGFLRAQNIQRGGPSSTESEVTGHRTSDKNVPKLPVSAGSQATSLLLRRRFHDAWQTLVDEAREHALLQLEILLAQLTERFGATSGWLFLREGEDRLCARVTYHTRNAGLTLRTSGPGIVAHVARTGTGYLTNDVRQDRLYQDSNPETKSELAVPIIDSDGVSHGVVNLECRLKDTFTHEQIHDLTVAVGCLVPHLLVLENVESCPYHPDCHGWDLSRVLNRLCHAIARTLDEAEGSDTTDTTSCTVWYCDHAKQQLMVFATSGFDIEYIAENSLPMDSFTGKVVLGPRHKVWNRSPERAPGFRRLDKIEVTGLKRILATPIHATRNNWEAAACATLNIYFFTERRRENMPSPAAVRSLAKEIGFLIDAYRTQRLRIAKAQMRHELRDLPQPSATGCEVIKEFLKKMFDANGVSIFAPGVGPGENRRLYLAATTGVERRSKSFDPKTRDEWGEEPCYDLDQDVSYTTYLALHCGIPVRKVDVVNPSEQGVPADFPPLPLNKFSERYALSELDRRRFLGIGVALEGVDILGVMRLNRASTAKPFTRCDEEMLAALAGLDECKRALVDARKRRRESRAIMTALPAPVGTTFRSPHLIRAVASFLNPAPIPNVGSSKALVDELVQSLLVIFQDYEVRRAGVLVDPLGMQRSGSRWYVCHQSKTRKSPPSEAWEAAVDRQAVESARRVLTFDRAALAKVPGASGNLPMTGIRLPFMVWTDKQLLRWTLALDFEQVVPWDQDTWNILFHATRCLSAILGQTDFVIRPNHAEVEPSVALAKFVVLTQDDPAIQATGAELRFRETAGMKSVLQVGQSLPETREQDWRSILGEAVGAEAATCGVRQWSAGPAWSVPLWLGPFVVGDLRCTFAPGPDLEPRRDELFRTIPGLWSRLTCELRTPVWEPIRFTQGETHEGITAWKEQLVLRPLNFQESEGKSLAADLFARL